MFKKILIFWLLLISIVNAKTIYVALNGSHTTPFTNGWTSGATNLANALSVATVGDIVLVTNGIYTSSTKMLTVNSVDTMFCVSNDITLRSL